MKEKIVFSKSSVYHPFLLAIFPVVFLVSYNIHLLAPSEIVLPSLLILAITSFVWVFLGFTLKNYKKSGFIASLGLVLFFSYGHIFNLLGELTRHRFMLIIFLIVFVLGVVYFVKTKRKLDNATVIANVIGVTLLVMSLITIFTSDSVGNYFVGENVKVVNENLLQTSKAGSVPNIYYVILDGYTSSAILEKDLNFDNQEFLGFLTDKGFQVSPESKTNYPQTGLAIAAPLNMKYLNYSSGGLELDLNVDHKKIIDKNQIMILLKSYGYTVVNISSGWGTTKDIENADMNLCLVDKYVDSELIIMLVRTSLLKPVSVKMFEHGKRDLVLCGFSELAEVNNKIKKPFFVFSHFLIPHPPFIFGANGEPVTAKTLDLNKWEREGYLNQIKFINKKLTEFIDKILVENKNVIIIIQGDHGPDFGIDWDNPTEEMLRQRMTILNAYYFPEDEELSAYEGITPVNSFRLIVNYYFDDTYDVLDDRIYFNKREEPYNFIDVTEILMNK